jgi:hypothetical protein
MRSAAVTVIAGAVVLVALIAVVVRLQSPQNIGAGVHPRVVPRLSRTAGTDRQEDTAARSEPLRQRLVQLRAEHAEKRRQHTEKRRQSLPTPPGLQVPEGVASKLTRALGPENVPHEEELEVAALEHTLLYDPDPEERAGAAFFLSTDDEDEDAYRALLLGLNDADGEVRLSVVEALEDFDELITVDALASVVNDPDPEVRFEVASFLGDIETPEALAVVREMMNDPDEDVRTMAEGIVELAE